VPETEDRALRIGKVCPNCVCESVSVGRHGSPGRVRSFETLYSVLIGPVDFSGGQIAVTVVTHAEKKGMSVLREAASDSEFETILAQRMKNDPARWFHGIAALRCEDIRSLRAERDTGQRAKGDRLYCVLDTDLEDLPHHADVFATVPRVQGNSSPKAAWRMERGRLMDLLISRISSAEEFRGGAFRRTPPIGG
jgi:hypothetical protein